MAVQELVERALDLKRDRATNAAPPECHHSRLLIRVMSLYFKRFTMRAVL
jgi:hypothetical protein